ncbi:MAG: FAD:protein FMN transferase [Longimicrobiales bacterium]
MTVSNTRFAAIFSFLFLLLSVPGGAQTVLADLGTAPESGDRLSVVEREAYVMGTRLGLRIHAPDAAATAEAALAAVRSVEARLSTWREDTELSALNRAPTAERHAVSPALLSILEELDGWVAATGGAFDPAIGALIEAWDIRGEGRVPGAVELAAARRSSGWQRLVIEPRRSAVTRTVADVWVDAGAFGKGLGLREAAAAIGAAGGTGTLNFGGQVVVVGMDPFRVDVAHPRVRDRGEATLSLADVSAASTSLSERGGHVLDPRTGRAVEAWGSVTVVAEDAMVADILSTALYVMGPDAALEWAQARPYGVLVQDARAAGEPTIRWNAAMERWLEPGAPVASRDRAVRVGIGPSSEAPSSPAQDTSEIERLKRQVEAITRELERMRLGGDVVAQADTGILGFGPAASKIYKVDQGVSIGGYGEILYRHIADELEDGTSAPTPNVYDALRAIIYVGYKFNDRLLVNTEIEIEHANEAFLEFAYLDYRLSDALGLRGGLLLSPMGLVNELHEPPVFLGSTRPMVEQRIIPTTWRENGLGVFGDVGPISYRAYAMNGLEGVNFGAAGLRGGRQKGSKALAEDVAGVFRADYTGVLGLLVGGSVYYGGSGQGVVEPGGETVQANTLIWEGHASYQSRGLDLRALVAGASVDEAAQLNAAGAGGVAERLGGGYAHAGYDVLRLVGSEHELFPYLRYEWLNTQVEVPVGVTADPANESTALLLGASWKPVPQVAVKADYQLHSNQAETGRNQFAMVLSYLF